MSDTAALLKQRFPEFASVDDDLIEIVMAEAGRWVDETWIEIDRDPATLHLAAHMLASQGVLGQGVSAVLGTPVSRKLGDAENRYASASASTDPGSLSRTAYGQYYLRLVRGNHPAVAVV